MALRRGHRTRPPLAVVFAVTVSGILSNTLIAAPLPDIVDDLGVPDSSAGLLVAAGSLPGIVMAPVVGLLADRFGRRQVLVPCLVLFGVAGLAGALAPTFATLVAARAVQGIGSAGLINLAVVLLADSWEGNERAKVIGWNAAVLTTSIAVFPTLGGLLADAGGWRWAFAPYGFALVTAAAVWLVVPDRPRTASLGLRRQLADAADVVRQPVVAGSIAFGCALFVLIFGLFFTAMPLVLEDGFGLEAGARGLLLSVPAVGSTLVALNLGRLRSRFGARRLLLVASTLFVVAFVAVGAAPTLAVLGVGVVVYGLGEGMAIPTVQDLVAGASPAASRGAVVAVWVGAARLGQTVGPLLTGVLLGVLDPQSVFFVGAGLAAALLGAQLVIRIRAPLPAASPPGPS